MHDQAIYSTTEKCRQRINNITNSFIPSLRQKILLKRKYCRSSNQRINVLRERAASYDKETKRHYNVLLLVMLSEGNRGYRLLCVVLRMQ